ncbi:olfactory receptor 7G1-like isoform X2 [Brienomyrus brachyistius]|uniref:olfactory receptor 7G1-like isoform X2 n=1 Tax=Brienomyrus brachyistius TaxID=42636 RepID=UPI0020B3441F|nr:olfactory receptor 7G1-like isoform X2 [Brienomyrus brachyistius]XP_048837770.1 olfactory receptor 7G1-like isoform X2 [Brienomyrus brachyistius]
MMRQKPAFILIVHRCDSSQQPRARHPVRKKLSAFERNVSLAQMENSSSELIFVLHGLNETRTKRQIFFGLSILAYVFTIFVNLTLIFTILLEKILHEPMFIFLCNLCANSICGSTSFYPRLLIDLLSDSHVISYTACIIQIFGISMYLVCEITNLTVMAYDRYVAICKPLEYHSIMTPHRVGMLVQITWFLSFLEIIVSLMLAVRLPLCGSRIEKLYCFTWDVVKLSCVDTTLNNIYGYCSSFFHTFQFLLLITSYIQITRICIKSQIERSKFMETCLPHLITYGTFAISLSFDLLSARLSSDASLQALRNSLSIMYLIVPPVLNPLIYGLKLKQLRRIVWRRFYSKITALK